MKKQQIQQQIQISAYQKKTVHDIFLTVMEWFEKYIEITYKEEFPDWEKRKQIHDNLTIKRTDIYKNPQKAEKTLSSQLHLFAATLEEDTTPSFREELKQEFYQWISSVEIDVNNCPERLKHFLFGFNEIFEGRSEKIRKEIENRKRDIEIDSPEYLEKLSQMFADTQPITHRGMELAKSLEGKTDKDIEIENKFAGRVEQGEEAFKRIASSINAGHQDFHFKEQNNQLSIPQWVTNSQIIQEVKDNPQNWVIDEVITEYDSQGNAIKKENALIHKLAEIGFDGAVFNWQQQIYLVQKFSSEEKAEIEQILGISQTSSTVQANRNLIEEIKRNIHEFEFQTILTFNGHRYDSVKKRWVKHGDGEKSETMLVHKSVQVSEKDYDELGNLSIQQDKMFQEYRFNQEEWTEIKKALENSKIIEKVNQNDWIISTVNSVRDGSYEALINKSAIRGKSLKEGGEFYNKAQFSDEEWAKIEIAQNPLTQHQNSSRSQVFSVSGSQPNQSNSSSLVITLAVISILLVSGLKLVKKHLNNKGKE